MWTRAPASLALLSSCDEPQFLQLHRSTPRGDPMVTLVGAAPTNPGDPLALCVTDAVAHHENITVEGLVTATYCGERQR